MSREFKFRAWDGEKFTYFGLFYDEPLQYKDIQQFTGLKDKTGKDIFEGDIIRASFAFEDDYIGTVIFGEYNQDGSGGEYSPAKCIGYYLEMSENDKNKTDEFDYEIHRSYYHQCSLMELEVIEVVGNIHENPNFFMHK
jgi:uncharacterized phage protein (TIGR01671 family)